MPNDLSKTRSYLKNILFVHDVVNTCNKEPVRFVFSCNSTVTSNEYHKPT